MKAAAVTAVVLNWRTPDYTLRAARALIADGVPAARVVVVDNGSGDGSAERVRQELAECNVLALDENLGFASANNRGARALPGEAYLFVNSDAFVHAPGSVERLVQALEFRGVGIAVPRLLNEDLSLQPSVVPISTPLPELVRASGLSRFVPNGLQPALGTRWDHAESRRIQAAIGPVLAIRAATWQQLGGFEERQFMYAEDADLFQRAAERGWAARFVADAEFIHLGGASSSQRWGDPQRAERVARGEAALVRGHLGSVRGPLTVAIMAAGVGARAAFYRVRGNRPAAEVQAAWFRGYVGRSTRDGG